MQGSGCTLRYSWTVFGLFFGLGCIIGEEEYMHGERGHRIYYSERIYVMFQFPTRYTAYAFVYERHWE